MTAEIGQRMSPQIVLKLTRADPIVNQLEARKSRQFQIAAPCPGTRTRSNPNFRPQTWIKVIGRTATTVRRTFGPSRATFDSGHTDWPASTDRKSRAVRVFQSVKSLEFDSEKTSVRR